MSKTKTLGWCWIGANDVEAEQWHGGGKTRYTAIAAATKARFKYFWIAPLRRATRTDVRNWHGDHDLRVGDSMVDVGQIQEVRLKKN